MGLKNAIQKAGGKAANKIAQLSALSPEQLALVEAQRDAYLSQKPDPTDSAAVELTSRLLAASSVEIFNAYLSQIKDLYVPVERTADYGEAFHPEYNIRYFNITKWVIDKKENSLEKLVNVYEVLSNEDCNIALVFHRTCDTTQVYLAVTNTKNADDNVDVEIYKQRLIDAIRGNFPGAEWDDENGVGELPFLKNDTPYSVATASNIPTEKSEKFVSQTIEKLLDGIIPESSEKEYTVILLATPIRDVESRKLKLAEYHSGLTPYAGWNTQFTYHQSDSTNSMAVFGVNVGASAGVQNGQNQAITNTNGVTDSTGSSETDSTGSSTTDTTGTTESDTTGNTVTDSTGNSVTDSNGSSTGTTTGTTETTGSTHTEGTNTSHSSAEGTNKSGGAAIQPFGIGVNGSIGSSSTVTDGSGSSIADAATSSVAKNVAKTATDSVGHAVANTTGHAVATATAHAVANSVSSAVTSSLGKAVTSSVGRAVTNSVAKTAGTFKSVNFGANFGANFARSSSVTATIGKDEGITQTFSNYNIKHALELLEAQMKRYEKSTALGMWDFAAYVLSEDQNVANNVAHSYMALTQGEESYMSQSAINLWRGDRGEYSDDAKEICAYLRDLRHPIFGLNPEILEDDPTMNVYPAVITATTPLSGKELAYSLNFPQKSVAGLPVIECAEFGRNITSYESKDSQEYFTLGSIYHMNHEEKTPAKISKKSLASHSFITGSTGSGKSNTVYQILDEARAKNVHFLVIEPAKGEYKHVFGNDEDVFVYGTNPKKTPLLRINPFSFPEDVHVLEHLDRLVEIFNVCWPMYAAMPAVLKAAIEKSYSDCGWDLTNSTNSYGDNLFPTFGDVARNVKSIINASEYDVENKGAYKGSLLTRLQSLTNGINGMIFCENEIAAEDLFEKDVIVDISRVGSSETKSLIMGMLVLKLSEHRMTYSNGMNLNLKHLTVLEEAHNILKRTSTDQPVEGGNLLGKSVEMIANAIAEMRTYGEGFIIADQAPGLLDMSAIRNTNTKIIMRLPDQDDRELVGKAANLNDDQILELAKLPCGVAAVYQNEWVQPILCKIKEYSHDDEKYMFVQEDAKNKTYDDSDRLEIASLLSRGTVVGKERVFGELQEKMQRLSIGASTQVIIMKMLLNPPVEPRMTKLAPIMGALFPEIIEAVKTTYYETPNAGEWTKAADKSLEKIDRNELNNQVRRDIIQATITYYFLNEIDNVAALKEWHEKGGLR